VRFRVSGKGKFKKTLENINLCHKWNIDVNILS
jgi:sulfatase maturation enzyme AslB (radical SAM superfamily)